MKRSKETAIYNRRTVAVEAGKFVTVIEPCEVRVMCRAEGYAMVRRKGAMPFVVSESDLVPDERSAAPTPLTGARKPNEPDPTESAQ